MATAKKGRKFVLTVKVRTTDEATRKRVRKIVEDALQEGVSTLDITDADGSGIANFTVSRDVQIE